VERSPMLLFPGGQGTAAARMGVNALTGAGSGFLEATKTGDSPYTNALLGAGIGTIIPGSVEGIKKYGEPFAKWIYTKALKTPISEKWKRALPGEEFSRRETAVNTGFNEKILPNQLGRTQVDNTISNLHNQVDEIIDGLTKEGKIETNVYELTKRGLAKARANAFSSSDSKTAYNSIKTIEEGVIKKGGVQSKLNPRQLQDLKEQFYREIDWDRTKNVITPGGSLRNWHEKALPTKP